MLGANDNMKEKAFMANIRHACGDTSELGRREIRHSAETQTLQAVLCGGGKEKRRICATENSTPRTRSDKQ